MVELRHRLPNGQSQWVLLPRETMSTTPRTQNKKTNARTKQKTISSSSSCCCTHTQFYLTCTNSVCDAHSVLLLIQLSLIFRHRKIDIKVFRFVFVCVGRQLVQQTGKCSRSTATVQTGDDFSLWPLDSQRSSCTMLHLMRIMKMTLGLLFSLKMHRTKLLCYFISFEMKILRVSCRTFMNLISSSTPSSSSSPLSSS